MADKKELMVFAGANGSGKSTLAKHFRDLGLCPTKFICPDQLVPHDKLNDKNSYLLAMQYAETLRFGAIAQGESFSFETVLSTQHKFDFIRLAKAKGYEVTAVYVITSDPKINLARIKQRVARGGHNVPEDKVLSRYEKSMRLMFSVLEEAHEAVVYDNSRFFPQIVLTKDSPNEYVFAGAFIDQPWVLEYLLTPAKEKGLEIIIRD